MRGSISYTELKHMTPFERELVSKYIDERLEMEKNNPHPVY